MDERGGGDVWDRALARLGAGPVVRAHPRLKWLLLEPLPFVVWQRMTGGFSRITPYFVSYLGLLGIGQAQLFLLPLVFYAGHMVQSLLLLLHHGAGGHRDPKRFCMRCTWAGRVIWGLVLVWPLVCWQLGLGAWWILGGVLAAIFSAQVLQMAGAGAWMTWTQEIVPEPLRGRFFAWRMLGGFVASFVFLQLVERLWPADGSPDSGPCWWLMSVFAVSWLLCLFGSTWLLGLAPEVEVTPQAQAEHLPSLASRLRQRGSFCRYGLWSFVHVGTYSCIMLLLKPYLAGIGVSDLDYSRLDAWVRSPALIGGILFSGWALSHWNSRWLATTYHCCLLFGFALLLVARAVPVPGVLAAGFALEGLGMGMVGVAMLGHLYRLMPGMDVRFPAVFFFLGGLGSLFATTLLAFLPHDAAGDVPFAVLVDVLLLAVILRGLSTPLMVCTRPGAGDAER